MAGQRDILLKLADSINHLAKRVRKLEVMATVNDMNKGYGWINGAWHKNPLQLGYSDLPPFIDKSFHTYLQFLQCLATLGLLSCHVARLIFCVPSHQEDAG